MTKIAIVGSRNFKKLKAVRDYVESLPKDTIVISGGARGVDKLAEDTAKSCGLIVISFMPNWGKNGKSRDAIPNAQIIREADEIVAFWDGQSVGTKNSIDRALKSGKPLTVFK